MDVYSSLVATLSIIISVVSAIIAYSIYRLNTRQVSGDVIYRIIEQFESLAMRDVRRAIYTLDRDDFSQWDNDVLRKVDMWGAELDVVATILYQEEKMIPFFMLYGDVILRSIYQLAPYANQQRTMRGRQFLLPLERFGWQMLKIWRRTSKRGVYPTVIGIPNWPKVSLSYDSYMTDRDCQNFLQKPG